MRIRTHTNPFHCTQRFTKQNWNTIFPNFQSHLDFEIGFGSGSFLQQHATQNPERAIVGIDVRKRTVVLLQESLEQNKLTNIHAVHGNGLFCLEDMFEDNTIDNIFIFHPDPWQKKKHHKRRLINEAFLTLAHAKLKSNGNIYVSTDVEELWFEILEAFAQHNCFTQISDDNFWNEFYQTRWNEISAENNRKTFYATFQRK